MFEIDKWQEIYSTIRKNKLRTFLTGFSVAWGIFMLILLLGSGTGLENGVKEQFKGGATNGVWISSGTTSMQYKGLKIGRQIKFTNEDYKSIKSTVSGPDHISARLFLGNNLISYKNEYGSISGNVFDLNGSPIEGAIIMGENYIGDNPDLHNITPTQTYHNLNAYYTFVNGK